MLVLWVVSLQIVAQKLQLTIEFPKTEDLSGLKLYAGPMRGDYSGMKEMTAAENRYSLEVSSSPLGFYNMMEIRGGMQLSMPLYVAPTAQSVTVKAVLEEGKYVRFVGDANNEVLSAFNLANVVRDRKLWMEKPSAEALNEMYGDYAQLAAAADPEKKASPVVTDYLKLWSYVSTYNSLEALPRALNLRPDSVPLRAADVLPAANEVLDCELAGLFQATSGIMLRGVPRTASLEEKIEWLRANYKTESLRCKMEEVLVEDYVNRFNYTFEYESGLKALTAATEKYGLNKKYLKEFTKRKAATKGSPFPAEVVLKDVNGQVVDFSAFKAKYVYIDVWASWCGPCCKEVPVLQELEKEIKNENLVFVSISTDATEKPWKAKMEALNMHGNQLIDASKKFCDALNIRGIPFFLMYDKEGKLYLYDAPRPSSGEKIRSLLEELK